jgi:GT2 family glycosyltransferase
VGQLDGALLVVNRHVFWRLGGFDERFELYYEDVDFCRTARTLGGCVISSTTWGVHEGGASFRSDPWPAFAVLRISRLRYFRKVGIGLLPGPAHLALSVLELAARTVTRRPEGHRARWSSLRVQARELRRPGSIWLLSAHDNPAARASLESSAGVPAVLSSQVRDTKST